MCKLWGYIFFPINAYTMKEVFFTSMSQNVFLKECGGELLRHMKRNAKYINQMKDTNIQDEKSFG
jgi:hypothetical protein